MHFVRRALGLFRSAIAAAVAVAVTAAAGAVCAAPVAAQAAGTEKADVVLRVCNWEEYIDLGDWDEEETLELESGDIIGENSMITDFEEWYEETYGVKVKVEYSTFGTNEDLYNMLTLGDEFDLVCPSEYMIMKLMREGKTVPLSEGFFDPDIEENYYIKGVSPYIRKIFDEHEIGGEPWSRYAAGYMWGVTGIVYNPEVVDREEASTWKILSNPKYNRQVTIKDNVRDSYFAAVGAIKADLLTSPEFMSDPDYEQKLEDEMNDTSPEMIAQVQDYLQMCKDNVYSFETDSGKADMITGKVVANYQWSGDGVYTMDQAAEDDFDLAFAVPVECTNIYFDGWVMLQNGIRGDAAKQQAAEAFINFCSRPDNAVRNMYYIGYTSVISGGDDPMVFEYLDYNYSAEEGEEETQEYDLGYFFNETGEESGEYVIEASADMLERQLYAAYPPDDVMRRSSIMTCFDEEQTKAINQMWINVRC
ncbi:MAG: extracellular solute-binding protein, partial [Lachnospiraceae bacterium]|nr:extracellular solute-binding protein [Lachnospiraceae bacterium]